jgi:hypothetical protein
MAGLSKYYKLVPGTESESDRFGLGINTSMADLPETEQVPDESQAFLEDEFENVDPTKNYGLGINQQKPKNYSNYGLRSENQNMGPEARYQLPENYFSEDNPDRRDPNKAFGLGINQTQQDPANAYGFGIVGKQRDPSEGLNLGVKSPDPVNFEPSNEPETPERAQKNLIAYMRKKFGYDITDGRDDYKKNRVTREEVDANNLRNNRRQLIAGLAVSGADVGNFQGKAVKSSVPEYVDKLEKGDNDYLASRRQLAKDALENSDRAFKGLSDLSGYEDKRGKQKEDEQKRDPNSTISKSYRDYFKNLGLNVPEEMSANQIEKTGIANAAMNLDLKKMDLEARKLETQSQREFTNSQRLLKQDFDANENEKQRQERLERERLAAQNKMDLQKAKPLPFRAVKAPAAVKKEDPFKLLPREAQVEILDITKQNASKVSIANQIDGYMDQWKKAKNEEDKTRIGQQMVKLLNSTQGADAVGAEEARRLANELEPYTLKSPSGWPRFGQDLEGFAKRSNSVRDALKSAIKMNQARIDQLYGRSSQSYNQDLPSQGASQSQSAPIKVWNPPGKGNK